MNNCEEIEKYLLPFVYNALDFEESEKVKNHLKSCKNCREKIKKILNIKILIHTTPFKEPENRFGLIKEKINKVKYLFFIKNFYHLIGILKKLNFKVLFFILPILITLIFITKRNENSIYILKAMGNLEINNNYFFYKPQVEYKLNKNFTIETKEGEILTQIDNNKLILLKENSKIKIWCDKNINIDLLKGTLIGKVEKNKNKNLIINVSDNKFIITGTIFSISREKDKINVYVKEGTVKLLIKEKEFSLENCESAVISSNGISWNKSIENLLLNEVKSYNFYYKKDRVKSFYIKTEPENSFVFLKNKKIGWTPLFFITDIKENSFIVKKENYLPKTLNLDEKNNYCFEINLEKEQPPLLLWKLKLDGKVLANPIFCDKFIIFADTKGKVYKIDPEFKNIEYKINIGSRITASPLYYKNFLFLSANDKNIYAIDFHSGKILWKRKVGNLVYSQPVNYKNYLYLFNTDGEIICLNIKNSEILLRKKIDTGFFSTPLLYNNKIIVGGLSGNIYLIELEKNEIRWSFKTKNRIIGSTPVVYNGIIFVGSNDKYLYAINLYNGKLKCKFFVNGEIFTSPILVDQNIIIATVNGSVYSISNNGKLNWKIDTNQKILLTPFLIDDLLYIAGEDSLWIINKYGILYTKYRLPLDNFFVLDKNRIFIFGKDYFLYQLSFKF